MINKVLPIDGWEASEPEYTHTSVTIKYEFRDVALLLCPHDRCPGPTIHRRYYILVRDLPLGIYQTTLKIEVLECWCPKCQCFHTVRPAETHYSMRLTWRLMWNICWMVKEGSVTDTAKLYNLSLNTVRRADKAVLHVIDHTNPVNLHRDALVIDEKHLGHKVGFITVVTSKEGECLYVGAGKTEHALDGFFAMLSQKDKEAVKVVSLDRAGAYSRAVQANLPNAQICYDRFHVVKSANDALTTVRRTECAKVVAESKQRHKKQGMKGKRQISPEEKMMKSCRYILTSNPDNLDEKGSERLNRLLDINVPICIGHMLKEELRAIYSFTDVDEAAERLSVWLKTARESGLKPFVSFAHRLSGHVEEFLNYFRYKMTSGVIEGLNSRIAKIQFQCRGLKDLSHLYLRLREISCPNFVAALQPVPYS